jgi:hypothetical protein
MMIWQNLKNKRKLATILLILLICLIPFFWYFVEIKPHVDTEINSFVENISAIKDPQTKVKEIANFTEKDYYQTYGKSSTLSILGIKLLFSITNDPYFVAYYKTGACGESASLFNFIANKSGFESRIVGTQAEDHQWTEIKINDRWVQVDPTIYYYYYIDPITYPTYKDLWFDNPKAYSTLGWYGGYSTVSVFGTNEDLTAKYCNTSKLSIFCQNCDNIKIKSDNARAFSIDQGMKNSEATFTLGKKNYSIIADKTIIPFFLVSEKNVSVSLVRNENVNISSEPEKIQPTFFSQFLFLLVIFGMMFVVILDGVKTGVKFYKNWKAKQDK